MDKLENKNTERIVVDIEPELKTEFKDICDKEERSMSQKMRFWIKNYLGKYEGRSDVDRLPE